MEEDKTIKRKKILRGLFKFLSYTLISVLTIMIIVIIIFIASAKISEKTNKKPKFGLYTIISKSMEPTIKVYDVVFVVKTNVNNLKKDDIITFYPSNPIYGGKPFTHRIVEKNIDGTFTVKGDANSENDIDNVSPDNIIGKVIIKMPELGKLQFFIASKSGWVIAIMIPALTVIFYDIYKLIKLIVFRIRLKKIENKHGNI